MNQSVDYTRQYSHWHSETPEHLAAVKKQVTMLLREHLPSNTDAAILDVGCGMGFTLLALQDLGYRNIQGFDIDKGQVESCQAKGLDVIQTQDSTAYLLSLPAAFDLIIVADVVEHVPHDQQLAFVSAIRQVLKPGGRIICSVPNANSTLASRWLYNDWTHHRSFSEHSLDFLLFNAGFDHIEIFAPEFHHQPDFSRFLSSAVLRRGFWKTMLHWLIFCSVRLLRRAQMVGELGWDQGMSVPLSLNILARATRPA